MFLYRGASLNKNWAIREKLIKPTSSRLFSIMPKLEEFEQDISEDEEQERVGAKDEESAEDTKR